MRVGGKCRIERHGSAGQGTRVCWTPWLCRSAEFYFISVSIQDFVSPGTR